MPLRRVVRLCRLGRVPFEEALRIQRETASRMMRRSCPTEVSSSRAVVGRPEIGVHGVLYLVEHPPVYTLGRGDRLLRRRLSSSSSDVEGGVNVSSPPSSSSSSSVPIVFAGRGGKTTYHGPGQIVMYPILDLRAFERDVRWYVRSVEEVGIRTLSEYGIEGSRHADHPGVWSGRKKLAALGIGVSKWITTHGMALNVCNDLDPFRRIVPCGIDEDATGLGVGSISEESGRAVGMREAEVRLCRNFERVFDCSLLGDGGC